MADKAVEQPEVAAAVEETTDKDKKVEECVKDATAATPAVAAADKEEAAKEKTADNGDAKPATENGDAEKDSADKKKETKNGDSVANTDDEKLCIKRKSAAGGDAPEGTPAEGATPEKKAKLDDAPAATPTAEAEANGDAPQIKA